MQFNVASEYGRLRQAIVHRPGRELVRMTPSTRDYFLFDDLLFTDHAQQEHDWLTSLLRDHLGVKLYFFDELLEEALQAASQRERRALISQVCRLESGLPPVEQRIGQLEVMVRWFQGHGWPQYTQDPEGAPSAAAPAGRKQKAAGSTENIQVAIAQDGESFDFMQHRLLAWCESGDYTSLAEELVEGIEAWVAGASPSERPGPNAGGSRQKAVGKGGRYVASEDTDALRQYVEGRLFHLRPLPNMMFMRDLGTVVGERLLLARMAEPGRTREPLLLDFVQRNHKLFKRSERWTWADARINDPAWPALSSPKLHLEGGNVLQLREDLMVLGVSGRTSMEAIQRISDVWRAHAQKRGTTMILYVLRLPAGSNHLDGVFSVISDTECVVYPPVFEPYGPASVDVVRTELGKGPVMPTRSADFFKSLREDGLDLTPIPCGGSDPADQQREQWFSAANLIALAPGKVVIYRSSEGTLAELAKHGYSIIDINDVQTSMVKLNLDAPGKWALKIKGSELSRGHGGPHSLVLPLVRDS